MGHPQQSVHAGGAEPAWQQRDTSRVGLRLMDLHILEVPPSPLGAVSWGEQTGGNGPRLPKPSLPGPCGGGYGSVPLSQWARGQK